APERRQNVRQRRCSQRRHDPDAPGKGGQLAFALGGKPAGGRKARFQTLELLVEGADPGEAHCLDVELEFSARLENRGRGAHLDGKAVFEGEPGELGLLPEEYAAYLGRGILQIEIAVAGGGAREVRDLS